MLSYNIQSSKMSFLVIDDVSTEVECDVVPVKFLPPHI